MTSWTNLKSRLYNVVKVAEKIKSMAEKLIEVHNKNLIKAAQDYVKGLISSGEIGEDALGRYLVVPVKETSSFEGLLPKNNSVINMRLQYDGNIREDDLAILLNRQEGRLKSEDKVIEFTPVQVTDDAYWKYTKR